VRLLFYADEPIISEAIRLFLTPARGIKLQKVLNDVDQIDPAIQEFHPDVLLLSLTPALHLGVIAHLCETAPDCRIVLWNRSPSREMAHQAIELGVRGILPRTCSMELMLKCLYKVREGELWFDRQLAADHMHPHRVSLTPRQAQLAQMVAEGRKNKEIAVDLSITEGAVKVYLSHLFDKLGTKDRNELAHLVMRNVQCVDQVTDGAGARLHALYIDDPLASQSIPSVKSSKDRNLS